MNQNPKTLQNRCVISISGADRKIFLQGLITNDINKASETQAIYTLMLSPVGRFLYDFFIIEKGEKLLVDCCKERVDEIVQKLSFYKLRSKVEIKKEDLIVVSCKSLVMVRLGLWIQEIAKWVIGWFALLPTPSSRQKPGSIMIRSVSRLPPG